MKGAVELGTYRHDTAKILVSGPFKVLRALDLAFTLFSFQECLRFASIFDDRKINIQVTGTTRIGQRFASLRKLLDRTQIQGFINTPRYRASRYQ